MYRVLHSEVTLNNYFLCNIIVQLSTLASQTTPWESLRKTEQKDHSLCPQIYLSLFQVTSTKVAQRTAGHGFLTKARSHSFLVVYVSCWLRHLCMALHLLLAFLHGLGHRDPKGGCDNFCDLTSFLPFLFIRSKSLKPAHILKKSNYTLPFEGRNAQ